MAPTGHRVLLAVAAAAVAVAFTARAPVPVDAARVAAPSRAVIAVDVPGGVHPYGPRPPVVTIGRCRPCGPAVPGRCEAGTTCGKSNAGNLTCVKPMTVGKKCTDPCWTCAAGLTCGKSGTCELPTIPRCKPCGTGVVGKCEAGTTCGKSNAGNLTCVKPMTVGKKCTDPCWTCAAGLTCGKSGTCELPTIPRCKPCGTGVVGKCEAGTTCGKINAGNLTCVKPMTVGKKCTDPCWTCAAGLTCGKSGTCELPTIPRCKPCGGSIRGRCEAGTMCRRTGVDGSTCVKPGRRGTKCTNGCTQCARWLTCAASSGTCELPTIPRCKPCGGSIRGRCEAGTMCRKTGVDGSTCVKPGRRGAKCTNGCTQCARWLTCAASSGTCERPIIRQCRPCGAGVRGRCEAGTQCRKNNRGALSCVKPMTVGKKCTDPCWTCAAGLTCGRSGTCQAAVIPACKPCGYGVAGRCAAGSVCARNSRGATTCVKRMGAGHKCSDPCWACAPGLTCSRWTRTCTRGY